MSNDVLELYKSIIYVDKVHDVNFKNVSKDLYEEIERLNNIIKEALDKLTIKQIRFINEKDYVLDDNDLDEIMKILDKGSDKE